MVLTTMQSIAIIAVCGICTLLERALPSSFSAAEPFQSLYAIWGVCFRWQLWQPLSFIV